MGHGRSRQRRERSDGLRDIYPESKYALAAWLFDRIDLKTVDKDGKDRGYYLDLMRGCLAVARRP